MAVSDRAGCSAVPLLSGVASGRCGSAGVASRGGQFPGGGVALVGILGQTPGDHLVEPGRQFGLDVGGTWRVLCRVPGELLFERFTRKRQLPGEAFVEHTRQRVDVDAGIVGPVGETLRRHVAPGAQDRAGVGQFWGGFAAGDPEIDQVDELVGGDQQIGRLDVAVHQSLFVGGVERRRHLLDDRDGQLWGQVTVTVEQGRPAHRGRVRRAATGLGPRRETARYVGTGPGTGWIVIHCATGRTLLAIRLARAERATSPPFTQSNVIRFLRMSNPSSLRASQAPGNFSCSRAQVGFSIAFQNSPK